MSTDSKIEWTDATWNPVTGCTKVSPGCAYCYAEKITVRFGGKPFLPGKAEIVLHPERLGLPLRWKKPRMVFVNSMSDLFHEDVPDEFIQHVFLVMAQAQQHTFQVLTKRPERMKSIVSGLLTEAAWLPADHRVFSDAGWPLPNVWLGVSVENQRWADARIPLLLETPASVRFLSCEPLLVPLDLNTDGWLGFPFTWWKKKVDWVIVGGESGGPADRRLVEREYLFCGQCGGMGQYQMFGRQEAGFARRCASCDGTGISDRLVGDKHRWYPTTEALAWVRSLRDQCVVAGVPFFFKQWGGPRPTSGGRMLDGRTWNEMPLRQAVPA